MNFQKTLDKEGWCKINGVLHESDLEQVRNGLEDAYEICRNIQMKNGMDTNTDGTVHHLLAVKNKVFLSLLDCLIDEEMYTLLNQYFQGEFILNSYGGVINMKNKPSYVANIHRDVRFFSSENDFMINVLFLIDDFKIENGATYLLSGSHKVSNKPEDKAFYENSVRAIGKAGDMILFNSKLWHAAGLNESGENRRAITITLTKPFFKQQLDYCRLLGVEQIEGMEEKMKQLLGYNSRTPSSLDEWYQPIEKRFYKSNQG